MLTHLLTGDFFFFFYTPVHDSCWISVWNLLFLHDVHCSLCQTASSFITGSTLNLPFCVAICIAVAFSRAFWKLRFFIASKCCWVWSSLILQTRWSLNIKSVAVLWGTYSATLLFLSRASMKLEILEISEGLGCIWSLTL